MAEPIWYYAIDDQEHGPVTPSELKEVARTGQLRPDDLVWKQGLDDWKPARHVAGLFPAKKKGKASPKANGNGAAAKAEDSATDDDAFEAAWKDESRRWRDDEPEADPPGEQPDFEPPPDAEMDAPPQSPPEPDAEPEPEHANVPAEPAAEFSPPPEPPAPPPMGTAVDPGISLYGEYRPQERLHRPAIKVGPVTIRVARTTVVVSLLMLVLLEGCSSLGTAYVDSLAARRQGAEHQFAADWESRRSALIRERNELQAKENKSTIESVNLGRALDDLAELDVEMAAERANLEESDWRILDIAARQAAASQVQWQWWLRLAATPLLFLLTAGSLLLTLCCDGQERWLGLALVVLASAAMLFRL